ncbi:MAG: ATP synthase F1 subunit gamma [Candidatus Eisenbacteria bacterium]|nr:ATP synthase F1 subunit gamma [Candidatus Eisenbacteria bacterium]
MQSLRDIRRRIKSISSTRQIARAMEMVSAARFRRAQERLLSARPYAEGLEAMVKRVCAKSADATHPLLVRRDKKSVGICVVASDRGLCGAFNVNVIREAERLARQIVRDAVREGTNAGDKQPTQVRFLPVGRKALLHFRRKEARLLHSVPEIGAFADGSLATTFTSKLIDFYVGGMLDEIWLVFTHFISSGSRQVITSRLLPLDLAGSETAGGGYEYIYEPDARMLLQALLPKYVTTKVFTTFAESCASEHSARMVAMSFATKNADDMVDTLTLLANRARQSSITREIADIVGGAELLR